MTLDRIQIFSPLLAHCGFKNPLGAAAYYILLIENFPTTFRDINKKAKTLMAHQIRPNQLQHGKLELLRKGFIAQVLPMVSRDIDFNREMFLPISPELAWNANVKKLDKIISPKELLHRHDQVLELENKFKDTFLKYGIGIDTEKGNITAFHSSKWLLYTLVNNVQDNQNLSLFLGSLGSFQEPSINYYKYMLEKGLRTKIIYDGTSYEAKKRIENIIKLKNKYPEKIEVKNYSISDRTSRKFIFDNMAIDGKKLLFEDSDLSYISTIYLQENFIKRLNENFEEEWNNALDIKLESIPI